MKQPISSHDLEQLSAYLDRQLDARERARLEARLQAEPDLRETLQGLHLTRSALRRAPIHRAPRNFTLKAVPQPQPRFRLFPVFSLASALSALFFVITLAGQFLLTGAPAAAPMTYTANQDTAITQPAAMEMKAAEAPQTALMAAPTEIPLIIWGTTAPDSGALMGTGMGGGEPEPSPAAMNAVEPFPKAVLPPETPTAAAYAESPELTPPAGEVTPQPEGEAQADSTRAMPSETPTPEPTASPLPTPTLTCTPEPTGTPTAAELNVAQALNTATPPAGAAESASGVSGSGPILGTQPTRDDGQLTYDNQALPTHLPRTQPPMQDWLPLPLALLALIFAGLAIFFQRKERL